MAKVTAPLMSLDASGGFGGALVFGKWKGRNTVRQLVTPANPKSLSQESARNSVRVVGTMQHWTNVATIKGSGRTITDKAALIAAAPAGQAWNGYLSKLMIGAGGLAYTAAGAAWTGLSAGNKTAWETAAGALAPALPDTFQTGALGVAIASQTKGESWYRYQVALNAAGIAPAVVPATPPTYA